MYTKNDIHMCREIKGEIHSVFHRVCNILTENDLFIPIISNQLPNMPRAISIELPAGSSMQSFDLKQGMEVSITDASIRVLNGSFALNLESAKPWDARPFFQFTKVDRVGFIKNIEAMRQILVREGNYEGIAAVVFELESELFHQRKVEVERLRNPYTTFIYPRIRNFLQQIMIENVQEMCQTVKKIVGFGPGLTPSGDDFLAGLMTAVVYCADYHQADVAGVQKNHEVMMKGSLKQTTRVSAEMLGFAAKGETSESNRKFLIDLFSTTENGDLISSIRNVLSVGETSGTDFLAGIYIGCRLGDVLYRKEVRS
ncbi:MAG: DUF2877 domain-containing protein [Bacillota bacterium]